MTPHRMKIHLARCDLGGSDWRHAISRLSNILDALKAINAITGWKNYGVEPGEGYIQLSWSFFQITGVDQAEATFKLSELRAVYVPILEVQES